MNAKKVKQIRKDLRARGIDFREVEYSHLDHYHKTGSRTIRTEQWFLVPHCGRAIYQQAKRGA